MKKLLSLLLAASLVTACIKDGVDGGAPSVDTPSDKIFYASENAAEGRLLVKLDAPTEEFGIEGMEITAEPLFGGKPDATLDKWLLVSFGESLTNAEVAEALAKDSRVVRVEYDLPLKRIEGKRVPMPESRPEATRSVALPFNDPELEWQWHYYNDGSLDPELCKDGADINLLNAWKYSAGDNRVIVAVCDGGVMANHPDLADNMWVNEAEKNGATGVDDDGNGYVDDIHGYNFVTDSGNVTADDHGTHVAGTISAVNNNGFAVCGIAGGTGNGDGVRLMSIQIFEGNDGCYSHQIAQGIKYAADNGAVIINNSWGYDPGIYYGDNEYEQWDSVLQEAFGYFKTNARLEGVMEGGLVVFAAGNETYPEASYPGAYRDYISVSAMSSDYKATYYTNYGPGVNVCAPGGDSTYAGWLTISSVSTTEKDGYEYMQGTSMACPHVSGCAALAVSYALKQGYKLTADELHRLILTSVHDINPYQHGTKSIFNWDTGRYESISLEPYIGKLGSGYIDAHLLLMQMDSTPVIYALTGEERTYSLEEYFGGGYADLKYDSCNASSDVSTELGIETLKIEKGELKLKATKPGSGRITVKAIVGGDNIGGNNIGGSYVEREIEVVVRGTKAENGGWL
ncbi:MAG: S8 family serine peptidase [Alistipes sp.]|nr:S8 family serine peptidase [Alistipes sp.]